MNLDKAIQAPEFQQIAALLREIQSPDWIGDPEHNEPALRARLSLDKLPRLIAVSGPSVIKKEAVSELLAVFPYTIQADPRLELYWTTANAEWLVAQMDQPTAKTLVWLLLGYASAEPKAIGVNEAAKLLGSSAPTVRRWCDERRVIGAKKIERDWLVPVVWVDAEKRK